MRGLITVCILTALGLSAQVTPTRTESRDYRNGGTPGPGCATATDVGKRFYNMTAGATNSTQYNCSNTAANTYAWELVGGGGSGASSVSQLTDFLAVRTTTALITIGAGNAQVGTPVTAFSSATASLGGVSSTGTAYGYVSSAGVLTVGHNTAATITCVICTTATGITTFPDGSIPLFTATFTSNVWDVSGINNLRAAFSSRPIVGTGSVSVSETGGVVTVNGSATTVTCAAGTIFGISFDRVATVNSVSASSALATRAYAFTLPCGGAPAKFGFTVAVVSGTCGGTCGFAATFYDSTGAKLGVTTNTTSGGSPDINTLGDKSLTLTTPPTLTAGAKYYIALSTTSTSLQLTGTDPFEGCAARNAIAPWCESAANAYTGTFGSMVGPATLGSLTDLSSLSADGRWPLLYIGF